MTENRRIIATDVVPVVVEETTEVAESLSRRAPWQLRHAMRPRHITPAPDNFADKPTLLTVAELSVRFADTEVLRNLHFQIRKGETIAVIGQSGCGKTVLLKTLIGLLPATAGRIVFDDTEIGLQTEAEMTRLRTRIGFVFQQAALFDSMNIEENIAFPLRQHTEQSETEIRDRVFQLLEEVGLSPVVAEKMPAELSGGMRKRVGFARALALEPELMLYDEPTTGLDPIMSDVINELMLSTKKQHQVTGIIVTHDMVSAKKCADRIVMLYPLSRLGVMESQILYNGSSLDIDYCEDERVSQFIRGESGHRPHRHDDIEPSAAVHNDMYKPAYPEEKI